MENTRLKLAQKHEGLKVRLMLSNGFSYNNVVYTIKDGLLIFKDKSGEEISLDPEWIVMISKWGEQ